MVVFTSASPADKTNAPCTKKKICSLSMAGQWLWWDYLTISLATMFVGLGAGYKPQAHFLKMGSVTGKLTINEKPKTPTITIW